jgi:hypothetical protein
MVYITLAGKVAWEVVSGGDSEEPTGKHDVNILGIRW